MKMDTHTQRHTQSGRERDHTDYIQVFYKSYTGFIQTIYSTGFLFASSFFYFRIQRNHIRNTNTRNTKTRKLKIKNTMKRR